MNGMQRSERVFEVRGMTCDHCVAAVKEEVSAAKGVEQVSVDLESGRLSVSGRDIDDAAVRTAVEEAGYTLA